MSITTTVKALWEMWPDVPLDERVTFRVRLDDRMTLRVVDVVLQDDGSGKVMVRGDELSGPLTAADLLEVTAQGGQPSVTRARVLEPAVEVEILDLDDPNEVAEAAEQPQMDATRNNVVALDEHRDVVVDGNRPEDQPQVSSAAAAAAAAVGHPSAQAPDEMFVWSTPKGDWASTSPLKLPRPVLERLNATVDRRMVGRQLLIAFLIERGLAQMERGEFTI